MSKNYAKSILPMLYLCSINETTTKPGRHKHICLQYGFLNILGQLFTAQEKKKIPLKISLLIDNTTGHPITLMDIYKETYIIFIPVNTTSILQPVDQGIIFTFKFYLLFNKYIL